MAIEKLSVILELVSGNYKKEAREAATATSGISGAAKSVAGSLGVMIGPAAIGGAIVGLVNLAQKAGENADRLFDLASQTGLTTDALQEWEFVAKTAGAGTEVFADAVKAVIKNLDGTDGATGAAAKAYDTLGVSVLDASGKLKDAGTITDETFTKLAGMEDITARNALAQDIFGKKWEETISVLDLGDEALGNLRQEARDLGVVLSGEALRKADKFRESMEKLTVAAKATANEGLSLVIPLLTAIADEAGDATSVMAGFTGVLEKGVSALFGSADATEEARDELDRYWSILDILAPGITASLAPWADLNAHLETNAVNAAEAAKQQLFMADATKDDVVPIVAASIGVIDRQGAAMSNAARAADTQRGALINLANAQADLLDPLGNVLRLQTELEDAQKRLTDAQADGETPARDLALAIIEVEQAELRLQGAGAALTPDQIQAFAQILITDFGLSEQAALDMLDTLNLLDGWTGTASFTLNMNKVASGGGGRGNINSGIFEFDTGGVVPGPRGSRQLIVAHGGETILPTHKTTSQTFNKTGGTINVYNPKTNNLPLDLQYAALLANVATLN